MAPHCGSADGRPHRNESPVLRQRDITASLLEESSPNLRDWATKLRCKVARAVTDGRVDAARAAEFHRLMTELLEVDLQHGTDAKSITRVDGQASR
jgi:hypothetical protein